MICRMNQQQMNSINYSYLSPPSKAKKIRYPKNYAYQNINGQHRRRLFARQQYEPYQAQHISKIKEYLRKKKPLMDYSEELLLRLTYSGHFMISEVTEKVKMYDEWHQNQLITKLQKPAREILEHGHLYSYGRDYEYCPNIIVKPALINLERYSPDDYFSAAANLLEPLEKHMMIGGVIEKWNLILDFQQKKLNFSNFQLLNRCMLRIAAAYPYRLKRLLMINSSPKQDELKNKLIQFLETSESEAKIMVIGSWNELGRWVPEDEREKKYGGVLANLCQYWPIHTTNKYEESESLIESEEDYKSVLNDEGYFTEVHSHSCHCGEGACHIY